MLVLICQCLAGGNYLNTLAGPKPNGSESEALVAAPAAAATASASQNIKKETEIPMTAAAATETALSVVAQWEEEKVIQPVGQDYVEELRGGDGIVDKLSSNLVIIYRFHLDMYCTSRKSNWFQLPTLRLSFQRC